MSFARSGWKSWELALAATLAVGTAALSLHSRGQAHRLRVYQGRSLQAATALYRLQYGELVRYGRQAPPFIARDDRGRPFRLADLLGGASLGVLAFLGGRDGANGSAAADLAALQARYRDRGLRVAVLLENPAAQTLPAWAMAGLHLRLLVDPGHRAARAYGVRATPATVLMDPSGRVKAVDLGFQTFGGATYLRQEIERRLDGRIALPVYDPVLQAGRPMPDFLALAGNGRPCRARDLRGHWTLFVLSAGSCPACQGLADTMRPMAARFASRGGRILWCLLDAPKKGAPESEPGLVLRDPLGSVGQLASGLSIPRALLIDPAGGIRAVAAPPIDVAKLSALISRAVVAAPKPASGGGKEAPPA